MLSNFDEWLSQVQASISDFVNAFVGLLTLEQWAAWREWLTTIGGLIALSIAVATYGRNVRLKREEAARLVYAKERRVLTYLAGKTFDVELGVEDLLQAEDDPAVEYAESGKKMLISVKAPIFRATFIVRNASKERISPLYAKIHSLSAERIIAEVAPVENLDPESSATIDLLFPLPEEGRPILGITLIFRDSSGRWWKRRLDGPLRRAKRIRRPSVKGTYWQHDPTFEHPAIKQEDHPHAVGAFKKVQAK